MWTLTVCNVIVWSASPLSGAGKCLQPHKRLERAEGGFKTLIIFTQQRTGYHNRKIGSGTSGDSYCSGSECFLGRDLATAKAPKAPLKFICYLIK
jgi:hypothetical protein